ncbi:MAG: hypothetical protein ACT4QE_24770 [Anaerolineales bacterium]
MAERKPLDDGGVVRLGVEVRTTRMTITYLGKILLPSLVVGLAARMVSPRTPNQREACKQGHHQYTA